MDKTTDKLYGYAGKFKLGCRMLDNPTHLRPKDEETKIEYFRKLGQYNGTPERQSWVRGLCNHIRKSQCYVPAVTCWSLRRKTKICSPKSTQNSWVSHFGRKQHKFVTLKILDFLIKIDFDDFLRLQSFWEWWILDDDDDFQSVSGGLKCDDINGASPSKFKRGRKLFLDRNEIRSVLGQSPGNYHGFANDFTKGGTYSNTQDDIIINDFRTLTKKKLANKYTNSHKSLERISEKWAQAPQIPYGGGSPVNDSFAYYKTLRKQEHSLPVRFKFYAL